MHWEVIAIVIEIFPRARTRRPLCRVAPGAGRVYRFLDAIPSREERLASFIGRRSASGRLRWWMA